MSGERRLAMATPKQTPWQDEMVFIRKHGEEYTFTRNYLKGVVESQLADLRHPQDVVVRAIAPDSHGHDVKLSSDIWQTYLIRDPSNRWFAEVWETFLSNQARREDMLAELRAKVPDFRESCMEFIYDLRHCDKHEPSMKRLASTNDAFYVGLPYFNYDTRRAILRLPTQIGTLQDALERLARRRSGTICAAHDLSPVFESALGVKWDKIRDKVTFSAAASGEYGARTSYPRFVE